ncbi:hypothetical protein JCM10207_000750 [Rhodosporidiobolus poonsookiae]
MKGLALDTHELPVSTRPSQRSSNFRRALVALLAIGLLGTLSQSCDGLRACGIETLVDVAKEIRWALTPLLADPHERALQLMSRSPVVDGHIDLPILARWYFANDVNDKKLDLRKPTKGHVDIPRLRKGRVGGFFWSVFVPCPEDEGWPSDADTNFTSPSFRVRDTIEQIDTARLLIDRYPEFELASTAKEWKRAIKRGKIGGMLGIEGGHQLGASLSTIRAYYDLGVRYITLTHSCHSPLADSCGLQEKPTTPRWNGLSSFGKTAIKEMNRLGMIVDVSHTHPKSASDALSLSRAPVIFSHSNARGVHGVVRNVPDAILRRIGNLDPKRHGSFNLSEDGEQGHGWGADNGEVDKEIPGGDTVIMLNFAPGFVSEWGDGKGLRANVSLMADHADYIGRLAGRQYVGIGSDFDGIEDVPEGLEDVSMYPNLIAELIKRGWTDKEIYGLTNGNILRVLQKVEDVSRKLQRVKPHTNVFELRKDLVKHEKPPFLASHDEEKEEL